MARPSRYDTQQLLDAAERLASAGGPSTVTMSAVAKAAGAPSGSLYHRFPDRPSLLSALWLRTLEDFRTGFCALAEQADQDPRAAALAAARHTVHWSRGFPHRARLLRYGARDFGREAWPAAAVQAHKEGNRRTFVAVRELAGRLGATDQVALERVAAAVVEVPYALVQSHLLRGDPVPEHVLTLVEECAETLLPRPPAGGAS